MVRRLVPLFALLCLAVAAMPAPAGAAKKSKANLPTIKKVSPMRVAVGRTLTIRGKNFSPSRRKNTIVFRSPGKRTAFAKPRRASRTKLVVRVPGSVERLLRKSGTKRVPTRFTLRVVTKRYGKRTVRRLSPMIVSATETGNLDCGKGSDFDGDLLPNSREKSLNTDPCLKDTDVDGVEDYFEVESALDLNQRAVPYPGKRPFPNALDPSDSGHDYDGDGLSMTEEYRAWAKAPASAAPSLLQAYNTTSPKAPNFGGPYGTQPRFGGHAAALNYSDGTQTSVDVRSGVSAEYRGYLDWDGDLRLTDDERDVDGDGLRNVDELHRYMLVGFYPPYNEDKPEESYGASPFLPRYYLQPDYLDWDSDGDGVWDGNDDQDNDDVANVDEINATYQFLDEFNNYFPIGNARDGDNTNNVLRTPYNACLPYRSRTCNRYISGS